MEIGRNCFCSFVGESAQFFRVAAHGADFFAFGEESMNDFCADVSGCSENDVHGASLCGAVLHLPMRWDRSWVAAKSTKPIALEILNLSFSRTKWGLDIWL